MANDITGIMSVGGKNVPLAQDVTSELVTNINNCSVVARLARQAPFTFKNTATISFSDDAKAEIVGEGQNKSGSDDGFVQTQAIIKKAQVTIRVTDELLQADADNYGGNLQEIIGQQEANALARQLDSLILHGVSDLSATSLSDVTGLVGQTGVKKVATGKSAMDSLDALESAVNEEWVPNGLALSRGFANELRTMRNSQSQRIYPELNLGLQGNVDGISTAVSRTVSPELAILGDWSQIRWGYVGGIKSQVLEFGDPDGKGDLARTNEKAIRTEVIYAFQILHPEAFAVLQAAAAKTAGK